MSIDPNNLSATATLTFADDFNSLSFWNGTSGTWDSTYWWGGNSGILIGGNYEVNWYIKDSYAPTNSVRPWTVSNGILDLHAAPADPSIQPLINNAQYTSGMITSYHSFSQLYGYFEMSAKLPAGQGLWPAFWLLPENSTMQTLPAELDVMEVSGNNPTIDYFTQHSAATGTMTLTKGGVYLPDMSTAFHTYGIDWEADTTTWYVDGIKVFRTATPADMHTAMYMIADLAIYGPYITDPTAAVGGDMLINYIHAYSAKSTVLDPVTGPSLTLIENFGSTGLSEVGKVFHLSSDGSGPSLKYLGADVVAGEFGAWAPIGAEQTANGYEIAWKVTGADKYTIWNTDSSGNYISYSSVLSGTSSALEAQELIFHQDLNGDGVIGVPTGVTGTSGSTTLIEVGLATASLTFTLANIGPNGAGGTGNDIFYAFDTNLAISGNGGHDAIVFDGAQSQYNITKNADGSITVLDTVANRGETHNLANIEELLFTDKTVFVENADNANIARLYSAALNRAPDISGLNGWEDVFNSNISAAAKAGGLYTALAQTNDGYGTSIAGGFTQSAEFQHLYGTLTEAGFVTQLYQNVLDRVPATAELNAWLGLIHNGYTREMVLVGFAESPENVAKMAADWLIQI